MNAATVLLVGFLLGLRHACEADHLAAVATLATRSPGLRHTVRQGVAWGLGHTLTLLGVGGAVLVLGSRIPDRLAQWLEMLVGVMLVLLGADVLRRLARGQVHLHVHQHQGGLRHLHAHGHGPARTGHGHPHPPPLRALMVGMVHGMAGSAALVVLSLGAVQSWQLGLVYIAVFGLGSVLGMALLSAVIAVPLRWSARTLARAHRTVTGLIGAFSCALGSLTVWQIGVVQGALGL